MLSRVTFHKVLKIGSFFLDSKALFLIKKCQAVRLWHGRGCPVKSGFTLDCLELHPCLTALPRSPEETLEVGHAVLMSGSQKTKEGKAKPVLTVLIPSAPPHTGSQSLSGGRAKVRGGWAALIPVRDLPEPLIVEVTALSSAGPHGVARGCGKGEKVPLVKIRSLIYHPGDTEGSCPGV